jgi:hypothetical protein
MMQVSNYDGTRMVFGIGSTGYEWRFFRLLDKSQFNQEDQLDVGTTEKPEDHSPLDLQNNNEADEMHVMKILEF